MAGNNDGWVMPAVEVGQVVLWNWNSEGRTPSPAVVLGVGQDTVNLSVHVSGLRDHILKQGVRHKDDPFLRRSPEHEGGVWELTPRDEKLNRLIATTERGDVVTKRQAVAST